MTPMKTRCPHCQVLLAINLPGPNPTECNCPKCGTRFLPTPADPASLAPKSSSGWLLVGGALVLVLGVLALCFIGGGIWWFAGGKKPDNQHVENPPPKTDPPKTKTEVVPLKTSIPDKTEPTKNGKTNPVLPKDKPLLPFDALGKRDRLLEFKAVRLKGAFKDVATDKVTDVIIAWESVKRLKYEEAGKKTESFTYFVRDHGWNKQDSNITPLPANDLVYLQQLNYVLMLSNLLPLLEDDFEIVKSSNRTIRGKPCHAVAVKRDGRPPVNLYFDSATNLLSKADFLGPDKTGQKSEFVECYFSDYRVADGFNHWNRQETFRDEKQVSEFTLTEVTLLFKAHDLVFAAPGLEKKIQEAMAEYEVKDKQDLVRRAVRQLGLGEGSDFARLVNGLKGPEPNRPKVRAALMAYAELRRSKQVASFEAADAEALDALLKTKKDADLQALGIEGATVLGKEAEPVVPALLDIVRGDPDPKLLAPACMAFKSIGVKSDAVLGQLEKHAEHADGSVRDSAALSLMTLGPDRIPLLRGIELMSGPNAEIRTAARDALRKKLATVTVKELPVLRKGLKNQSRDVCLVLIEAIGVLKEEGKDAAPDLTDLLGSNDPEIARQAALALEDMGKLVEAARLSSDSAILKVALDAMKTKKSKSDDALAVYEKHLDHVNADVKSLAALAILELGPDRIKLDRLGELMARSDDKVRTAATKTLRDRLGAINVKDLPALRQGLQDKTKDVRIAFIDAIASLRSDGKDAIPDLVPLVAAKEKDVAVHACQALESMGKVTPEAIAALVKSVAKADPEVQVAAALALVKLDPEHAVLKDKGVNVLADNLKADVKDLEAFLAKPLRDRSAAALIELGEPAVEPIMKRLLQDNSPTSGFLNQDVKTTATRYMAFEMLRELAKRAKAGGDMKLIESLKKHESRLQFFWEPAETKLALFKRQSGTPAETLKLYTRTAQSADQAYRAMLGLKAK